MSGETAGKWSDLYRAVADRDDQELGRLIASGVSPVELSPFWEANGGRFMLLRKASDTGTASAMRLLMEHGCDPALGLDRSAYSALDGVFDFAMGVGLSKSARARLSAQSKELLAVEAIDKMSALIGAGLGPNRMIEGASVWSRFLTRAADGWAALEPENFFDNDYSERQKLIALDLARLAEPWAKSGADMSASLETLGKQRMAVPIPMLAWFVLTGREEPARKWIELGADPKGKGPLDEFSAISAAIHGGVPGYEGVGPKPGFASQMASWADEAALKKELSKGDCKSSGNKKPRRSI